MRSILTALAAVALALALGISDGTYHPAALALVTLSAVASVTASTQAGSAGSRGAMLLIGMGIVLSLAYDTLFLPGLVVDPSRLGAFRPTLAVTAVLLSTYLWRRFPSSLARWRPLAVLVCCTTLGALVILASPAPQIDVFHFQQEGSLAILAGRDPYAIAYRNLYWPSTAFYSPLLLTSDARWVTANPYPPLSLLAVLPAAALGDARWTMLVAAAIAAFLIRCLGRGSYQSELAAALMLLQPRGFMILELSYTEPFVLTCLLLMALAVRRDATWLVVGAASALAIASKQYAPLLVAPLLFAARERWRAAATAVLLSAAIFLPFLLWNTGGFVRSLLTFQVVQPFRADALSWPAALVNWGGPQLPAWPAFLLAAGVLAATLHRGIQLKVAMIAGSAAWIVFVAFNKQAFGNYYWLAVGLLLAACAMEEEAGHPARPAESVHLP